MSSDGKSRSPSSPSSTHHFLAGLATGCLSACLLQPADLLKTRLQQSHATTLLPTLRGILAQPHAVRNLWRGTAPSVIRTGLGSALYFSTLNALRVRVATATATGTGTGANSVGGLPVPAGGGNSSLPSSSSSSILPKLSTAQNLLTGALARAGAGLVLMPLTVLKVRYESSLYSYPSMLAASRGILATEGLRGFFVGYGATAIRDAPYAGLYVVFYEACKARLGAAVARFTNMDENGAGKTSAKPRGEGGMAASLSIPINFTSGALAAMMATTATNPFDAVKTRLQLMPGKYGNMASAALLMVRGEGWRSLFDGLGLRVGRKAVSSALTWTGYEELVRRVAGDGR